MGGRQFGLSVMRERRQRNDQQIEALAPEHPLEIGVGADAEPAGELFRPRHLAPARRNQPHAFDLLRRCSMARAGATDAE